MARSEIDTSIERVSVDGFQFPLGVYPVEPLKPRAGYSMDFEPADGGEEPDEDGDQWEEWPDRYMFDVVISSNRLEPLVRSLLGIMPPRVYPILDVLGQDAYREVDPYVAYELVGQERVIDAFRRFRGFLLEDGLCGFGAMVDEPLFMYFFVDEHKIVTIRAEVSLKEKIEKILAAFDLEQVESPAGADAAAHEHRGVLEHPPDRPDLLTMDEIVENLRDHWRLSLNIDPESNVDDDGKDLGVSYWRCLVRCAAEQDERARYVESLITAGNLREAEDLALDASDVLKPENVEEWQETAVVASDRMTPDQAGEFYKVQVKAKKPLPGLEEARIIWQGWLE